ncbi:hypothetical protein Dimus_035577 [Dionaea muscipula]
MTLVTVAAPVDPGDSPEGKEQALYFDAHVLDAQRRRHDAVGRRRRFLVRYDHDLVRGGGGVLTAIDRQWSSDSATLRPMPINVGQCAFNPASWPSLSPAILPSFVMLIADHHHPAHRRPPGHLQLLTLLSSADFKTNAGHLPSSYHHLRAPHRRLKVATRLSVAVDALSALHRRLKVATRRSVVQS